MTSYDVRIINGRHRLTAGVFWYLEVYEPTMEQSWIWDFPYLYEDLDDLLLI